MRIAHLSDVHVLAVRPSSRAGASPVDLSTRFVSFGRVLDPEARLRKLGRALCAAREGGADHVVISGDLTELGTEAQLETFAEALHDSGIDPERITLVPGNHDAYTSEATWSRALAGPLAAFRRASAGAADAVNVFQRDGVAFLPLDVSCHQNIMRAAGELSTAQLDALESCIASVRSRADAVVLVLHHSPFIHSTRAWHWLHGLRGAERLTDLLARHEDIHVLHGHLHHAVALAVPGSQRVRVFGASAVVDDADGDGNVRFYEVRGGILTAATLARPIILAA